ncbi:DUF1735 and LamG domain-containing protein [Phocaeicola sp.]|uniref:DUF1735 and LamG domain-containing protein n=1 Tax=Phocaeicola sp. TaxID=2773926 RepID=UPI0038657F0C
MQTKLILLMTLFITLFSACKNAEDLEDVLYFTGTETSPVSQYTIDGPTDIGITVSSSCLASSEQKINISVATEKLEEYNHTNGKTYKGLPEGSYKLSSESILLKAGENVSEQLILSLLNTSKFEEGAVYCLPLTISNVEGGMPVLESSRTIYIVLNQTIITQAAASKNMPIPFEDDPSLASVPQVTMEARVMVTKFASSNPYISTVMGVEEEFLLRFGDVTIEPNQLQLAGGGYPVTAKTEFETNKWYHLAVVFDGSTIKLYVNGELDGQTDAPRGPIVLCGKTDKRRFCIGGSLNSRLLNGYISEVRVWKKALSQSQIQNNMCYVSPDNYKDMIAYWRFNDGADAEVIKDWTGNGWDINTTISNWVEGVKCPE